MGIRRVLILGLWQELKGIIHAKPLLHCLALHTVNAQTLLRLLPFLGIDVRLHSLLFTKCLLNDKMGLLLFAFILPSHKEYHSFIFPGGSHIKNLPSMQTWVRSLGWEDPWGRECLPTPVLLRGEFHIQSLGLQSQTRLSD